MSWSATVERVCDATLGHYLIRVAGRHGDAKVLFSLADKPQGVFVPSTAADIYASAHPATQREVRHRSHLFFFPSPIS